MKYCLAIDMPVSYLQATCRGRYTLRENCLTNDRKAQVDLAEEIKNACRRMVAPFIRTI